MIALLFNADVSPYLNVFCIINRTMLIKHSCHSKNSTLYDNETHCYLSKLCHAFSPLFPSWLHLCCVTEQHKEPKEHDLGHKKMSA